MANFDEKSIFNKSEEEQALDELNDDIIEEEIIEEECLLEDGVKILAVEHVETKKEKKVRLKQEAKVRKQEQVAYKKLVKQHRRALKKHPENINRYETDIENGLPNEIIEKRIMDNLVNKSDKGSTKSIKKIIFSNIVTWFNFVTIMIAIWLISVKAFTDLVFLAIVTLNIIIGIYQEIKAKKSIDRLSLISAPAATVVRSGEIKEITVEEVVLDDLILLESGNQICADSIVVSGSVEVNESLLTGESDAIIKKPGDLLFSGSYVVSGRCRARVDKVGKDNYIEKLSSQAKKYKKPKSDLLKSLNWIIWVMSFVVVIVGLTLFVMQYLVNGIDYVTAVRKTAGAMVGMIPSGLWLLTSVALFVGIIKLAQKNVLVQELYCIEMLARVNVLCLDKTGTITDGTMSVKNVIDYTAISGLTTKNIISAMLNALNESNLTSKALVDKFGLNKRIKYLATIPFSSQRKMNAVTFDKLGTFALGAPEFVLKKNFINVKKDVDRYSAMGYRVLSLAHFDGMIQNNMLPPSDPELVSLILIEDNIRPDAIETIDYFKKSGVKVRVISGDNPITVAKISERAGIENADQYISLDGLTDAEVERAALKYTVFGRVSPSQKKLLVTTLKKAGNCVAMTGDGVNDILALKEADCSIAIASGSEAARNVSHLVLLDSNFGSMPKVVAEGRRVINNVTSVAALYLTKTIFSLLLAIQAMLSGGVYPISTNQLILIDVLAIGLPSFVLALEPNNREVQGKFLFNVLKGALPGALTILIISLIVFLLSGSLSLDSVTLSSIIVIAATHTCLMVLFKVSKPWNALRRVLCIFCYSVAALVVFLMPHVLELRPLITFAEYYSPNLREDIMKYSPQIEISDDYYYVFDGKVTDYQRVSSEKNISISSVYDELGNAYYTLNGTNIYEEVIIPNISFLENHDIVLGGSEVFIIDNGEKKYLEYSKDYADKFKIDKDGYLYYETTTTSNSKEDDKNEKLGEPVYMTLTKTDEYYNYYNKYGSTKALDVHVCIMPIVELKNDQLVITTNTSFTGKSHPGNVSYKTDLTSRDNIKLSINTTNNNELLVNGNPLFNILEDGTKTDTYKINYPVISFGTNNRIVFNGINTTIKSDSLGIDNLIGSNGKIVDTSSIKVAPYDASYYIVRSDASSLNPANGFNSNIRLSNPLMCPSVTTTVSGYYIIDGYYTNFLRADNSVYAKIDSDLNLIIGDVVTDYKVPSSTVTTSTSGIVKTMPTQSRIFLAMLCLLSVPLMRFFQGIVPWLKKQIEFIQKVLGKM